MVYSLLLLDNHDEQNIAGEHSLEFHDGAWAEPNTTEHIVAGVSSKSADGLRESLESERCGCSGTTLFGRRLCSVIRCAHGPRPGCNQAILHGRRWASISSRSSFFYGGKCRLHHRSVHGPAGLLGPWKVHSHLEA